MRPSRRLAQPFAYRACFALEQENVSSVAGDNRLYARNTAPRMVFKIDAPFLCEYIDIERRRHARMGNQLRNIKAYAASTHDSDLLPHDSFAGNHINIADRLCMIDALYVWTARGDARRDNNLVIACSDQGIGRNAGIQSQIHIVQFDHPPKVTKRFVKLFLTGNFSRQIKLSANAIGGIEQCYAMAAFSGDGGKSQP